MRNALSIYMNLFLISSYAIWYENSFNLRFTKQRDDKGRASYQFPGLIQSNPQHGH